MNHWMEQVEPPLNSRSVQIPVAMLLTVALIFAISLIPNGSDPADREIGEALTIDLNSASPRELSLLPGVGKVLAKRIAENRARLGPFDSAKDVGRVHGVGDKTINLIARFVTVDSDLVTR
jgi:DNA uptake protein ComE-like DNA-binding protein